MSLTTLDCPELQTVILEIVDNQLRDNDPPETRATLERLLGIGIEQVEARRLIACTVLAEMFTMMKRHTTFDRKRVAQVMT